MPPRCHPYPQLCPVAGLGCTFCQCAVGPPLLPAQLRPSLFCFRFLRSSWVTSLQCRGSSSRKDSRLEELSSLGEVPAQAELSPCTPSQHHVQPNQGRGGVGSHGASSAADNCSAPLPGGHPKGRYLCSGVPTAPAASAREAKAGLGQRCHHCPTFPLAPLAVLGCVLLLLLPLELV